MPDWVISLFCAFVVFPIVGALYVAFVHWLGSRVVKASPLRLVRLLSTKLWTTHWDRARQTDRIGLQVEDRLRKRIPR